MAILNPEASLGSPSRTMTVGVTGGMGSGKSVVCDFLEARGVRVFDADEVGKEILWGDPDARREIVREFGPASYREDGSLNRSYLASVVFSNAERLSTINAIVHPRVFAAFSFVREQSRSEGLEILVHEAALLFESGADHELDCVTYVDAPRWLRIRRVVERDGRPRKEILARMQHQLPAYRARARADYVIRNDGTLDQLEARVDRLLRGLRRRRQTMAGGV